MSNIDSFNFHKDKNDINGNNGIENTDDAKDDDNLKVSCSSPKGIHKKQNKKIIKYSQLTSSSCKEIPFPVQLHKMLTENDHTKSKVFQWCIHGRAFEVYNVEKFEVEVLPDYFDYGEIKSFQRQLKSYGFRRITVGRDYGAYYHGLFLRGCPELCHGIDQWERKVNPSFNEIDLHRLPYLGMDGKIISKAAYSRITKNDRQKRMKLQHKEDPTYLDLNQVCKSNRKVCSTTTSPKLLKYAASSDEIDAALAVKHGIVMSDHPLDQVPFFLPLHLFCE